MYFIQFLLCAGKFTEDRWLKKTGGRSVVGDALGAVGIGNGGGDLLNTRGGGGSMINVNGMSCDWGSKKSNQV